LKSFAPAARPGSRWTRSSPSCSVTSGPAAPVHDVDISDAAGILAEEAQRREDKFRDSWAAEHNKEDVLARKFEEALKKANEQPAEKPYTRF
jgi:hypothetical protein